MSFGVRGKLLIGLSVLMAFFIVTEGCTAANKTLKVGIESNFRPFTYSEGGENKGFEVELWKAISKEANLKYELVPMQQSELNKAVQSGKVDLAVAGMTVNKARKDNFVFSDPYFQTGLVILTNSDNGQIKSKDDLAGKVVATKIGSTAYTYASGLTGIKEVRGYPDISEAYDKLKNKSVDAVIFDERNVHDFQQNGGEGKVKIVGETLNKESYAVVAKKRSKYIGRINQAIGKVVKDGTYETLYAKWFGGKPAKLPGK
ncbi:transporter substrate-binding domain-containing protein [Paenibacillus allorhizosphaerae]|uniref:Glutamine-binding periplasmic protein n=1 Tax=Paenibacillus allorhizosphaerae TaxID=2849866 RepID=A0ABM8VGH4_9BACL|nr:transporter substrate-binding domain-containing protein [Paenibacillus allorhizosphaerae]CAG7636290.1 Glutamine-binding periplasmic protein [Paenibacillus allorhizosphaerae]